MSQAAPVAIIMGSISDWDTMQHAASTLDALQVPHDKQVISAHRTPQRLYDFATNAQGTGVKVIIAGAGGAAHLPGMAASMTTLPGGELCPLKAMRSKVWIACCPLYKCPAVFLWAP